MSDLGQGQAWHRSSTQRIFSGVCGGLAESWGTNPNMVRFIWVLITFWAHFWLGVLVYLAATVLLPLGGGSANTQEAGWKMGSNAQRWVGLGLMLLGGYWLIDRFFPGIVGEARKVVFPLILILIGLWVVLKDYKRGEE